MSLLKKIVYALTQKPSHYVHMDKPKTLQDHRQVQYNNWCKRYGVYNGSYLPKNPDMLTKKGWERVANGNPRNDNVEYQRKSDSQFIRYDQSSDKKGKRTEEHYHWKNGKSYAEWRKVSDEKKYIDRYGKPCKKGAKQSHLAPLDKDFNYN